MARNEGSRNDAYRRYFEAASVLREIMRARAEDFVRELMSTGDAQRGQAQHWVDEMMERSRKAAEDLVDLVRTEVTNQLEALGLDTDELSRQAADIMRRSAEAGRRAMKQAGTRGAGRTGGPARTPGAAKAGAAKGPGPVKTAAPAKKAGTSKKTGPAKKAGVAKKAPAATGAAAKKSAAKKTAGTKKAAPKKAAPTKKAASKRSPGTPSTSITGAS